VWDRIATAIEGTAPELDLRLPDRRVVPLRAAGRRTISARAAAMVAAAAALLVGLLGVGLVRQDERLDDLRALVAADALDRAAADAQNDPDARLARLESDDGGRRATAAVLPDGTGYLVARDLPALDDDRTYQLWGVTPDDVISLGVLGPDVDVAPFTAHGDVEQLVLTDEVAGGVEKSDQPPALAGELA
jgi:hypothetical protein